MDPMPRGKYINFMKYHFTKTQRGDESLISSRKRLALFLMHNATSKGNVFTCAGTSDVIP